MVRNIPGWNAADNKRDPLLYNVSCTITIGGTAGYLFQTIFNHDIDLCIGQSEYILKSAIVLRNVFVSALPLLLQVDARHQKVQHHGGIEVGIELGKDLEMQAENFVIKRRIYHLVF
jgi:hypothetical protein